MVLTLVLCLLIFAVLVYAFAVVFLHLKYPVTKWDWSSIDTGQTGFPEDFLWGTATAAHQIEGGNENSNWGEWERDPSRISDGSNATVAVEGWDRFREDVMLMKPLGVNSYRFSLSWNRIEPRPGEFDEDALRHYDELIDELLAHGIEPMITLHHFTHPDWFEHLGAFEKEANLDHFVRFAKLVFARYRDRVRLWVTINEPNVFVTSGYFITNFPPGKFAPKLAGEVLKNMLIAHLSVYRELRSIEALDPLSSPLRIGLAASIFQFEPLRRWHLGDWMIARVSSNSFNESVLRFFRTGKMRFRVPLTVNVEFEAPEAKESLDFIGVNYYSHFAHRFDLDLRKATESLPVPGEQMTDMGYTIYPEGIHRAIADAARIGKPVIITENGIADARNDRREKFIRESLYAVSRAIADGFDVRGYYYWTLMDNFEWAEGYTMKFGLYEVDLETQERRLRIPFRFR